MKLVESEKSEPECAEPLRFVALERNASGDLHPNAMRLVWSEEHKGPDKEGLLVEVRWRDAAGSAWKMAANSQPERVTESET